MLFISKNSICALLISPLLGGALSGCNIIKTLRGEQNAPSNSPGNHAVDEDISSYAEFCRQELGFVGVDIKPLNCLDGAEVPLLIDGKPPTNDQYGKLSKGQIECDTPSWLEGVGCVNYNFVQHRAITPDVDLALVCRSRSFSNVKDRAAREAAYRASSGALDFRSLFYFDSLGMIVTNKKTGKTCFFDQVVATYGGYIPFPDRREPPALTDLPEPRPAGEAAANQAVVDEVINVTPAKTWKKPFQTARLDRCTICHDGGPWKHTPWLPAAAGIPPNPTGVPFIPIGPVFEGWRSLHRPTAVTTVPVDVNGKKEPQLCTSCHRIGYEDTCRNGIDFATGHKDIIKLTKIIQPVRAKLWMPPETVDTKKLNDHDFEVDWQTKYKAHYDALRRCCDNPGQEGCVVEPFG
jgi:hypothetical protein